MTYISGITPQTETTQPPRQEAQPTGHEIDKDLFLKLLVTQLKYQDPLSEQQDIGDMITQLTLFTLVEQVTAMQQTLGSQKDSSDSAMVLGLLNKEVMLEDENGFIIEGVVSAVSFMDQRPYLTVNGYEYPFSNVIRVEGGEEHNVL